MGPVVETLRVELVHLFGTGRAHGKPSAVSDHLQSAEGGAVAWRGREDRLNGVAREFLRVDLRGGELCEPPLLVARGRRIDALVHRRAELARQLGVPRCLDPCRGWR